MTFSEFTKLADILNESVLADKKYGQALDKYVSCSMLFDFWRDVVGKRFEKITIPYDIKGTVLFVSVASPAVIQDLSFMKADIIKKYAPYAEGLNFKITDIRFDYKNWMSIKNPSNGSKGSNAFDIDSPEYFTQKDYETICLDNNEENEFAELKNSLSNVEFLPEKLKEKIYNNALVQYKAQKLRKK